jgi:hypothetical protein
MKIALATRFPTVALDQRMNWRPCKPVLPFAIALPVVVAGFAGALAALGRPGLIPLLLGVVFLFAFLGARRIPLTPIRAALLTAGPLLVLQVLGLVVLGFAAFSVASSSPGRVAAVRGAGLMFLGSAVIGGSIVSITLVSMLAGWIVNLTGTRR